MILNNMIKYVIYLNKLLNIFIYIYNIYFYTSTVLENSIFILFLILLLLDISGIIFLLVAILLWAFGTV